MSEPAADSTVGSPSALTSLLNSLEGTLSGAYYIDLEDGDYGSMVFDQVFAHPVWIRSQSRPTLGAEFTVIDMDGAQDLHFKFVRADGGTGFSGYVRFNGSTDCGIYNSEIQGDTSNETEITSGYGVLINNGATGATVNDCYFSHWYRGIVSFAGDDLTFHGNVFNKMGADDFYIAGCTVGSIQNNWGSRIKYQQAGEHIDFLQVSQNGTTSDVVIRGNVMMWQDPTNTSVNQFLFLDDIPLIDITAEQNICLTNASNGFRIGPDNTEDSSGIISRFNTLLRATDNQQPSQWTCISTINAGALVNDDNIVAATTGTNGGAGANGIPIEVGSTWAERDYSDYATLFDATLNSAAMFGAFMPKVGTRAHWDHADPTGAYDRLREIFELGWHPGNVEGPTAARWNALYNADGAITSGGATATPATGEATAEGIAPTASDGTPMYDITVTYDFGDSAVVTADVGEATAEGVAAEVSAGSSATPGAGEALAEGQAPDASVGDNASATPGAGDALAEGWAPSAAAGASAGPEAGSGLAEGVAPDAGAGAGVTTDVGDVQAEGVAPQATATGPLAPGEYAFTYRVQDTDTGLTSDPATVTVTVNALPETLALTWDDDQNLDTSDIGVATYDLTFTLPALTGSPFTNLKPTSGPVMLGDFEITPSDEALPDGTIVTATRPRFTGIRSLSTVWTWVLDDEELDDSSLSFEVERAEETMVLVHRATVTDGNGVIMVFDTDELTIPAVAMVISGAGEALTGVTGVTIQSGAMSGASESLTGVNT